MNERGVSAHERLAKWKIEKGRPPRPEKPWIPLRKLGKDGCLGVKNMLETTKPTTLLKKEIVATTLVLGSLKRPRASSSCCNASKRHCTQDIGKENIAEAWQIPENDQQRNEVQQVTPNMGNTTMLQKSRNELLLEWKKTRQSKFHQTTSEKSELSRRITITTAPQKKPSSLNESQPKTAQERNSTGLAVSRGGSQRRQTIVITRTHVSSAKQSSETNNMLKASKSSLALHHPTPLKAPLAFIKKSTTLISNPSTRAPHRKDLHELCAPVSNSLHGTSVQKPNLAASQSKNSRVISSKSVNLSTNLLPNTKRVSLTALHHAATKQCKPSLDTRHVRSKFNPLIRQQRFPIRKVQIKPLQTSSLTQTSSMPNVTKSDALRKLTLPRIVKSKALAKMPVPKLFGKNSELNPLEIPDLTNSGHSINMTHVRKSHPGILKTAQTPMALKSVAFKVPFASSSCSPLLRKRLSAWLSQRNKTPPTFRHFQCFDVEPSEVMKDSVKWASHGDESPSDGIKCSPEVSSINSLFAVQTPLRAMMKCDITPQLQDVESKSELELENSNEMQSERLNKYQSILEDVNMLLDKSFSPQAASNWLDALYECTQAIRKLSTYWVCRAKISQLSGSILEAVDLIEMGITLNAQPNDLLLTSKLALLKMAKPASLFDMTTPKSLGVDLQNAFPSTVIHYVVKDKTPIKQKLPEASVKQPTPVIVTPVRRCSRLSNFASTSQRLTTSLPANCNSHCVASLDDIPDNYRNRMILVPNRHLRMLIESPPDVGTSSIL